MPPGGFFFWHTNKYDNKKVAYRVYLISVDRPGESGFKYQRNTDGAVVNMADYHGALRIFKNTHTEEEEEKEGTLLGKKKKKRSYLWHTAYSKRAHRHSIGFEIPPEQLVALMDACEGCWEDVYRHLHIQSFNE